MSYNVCYTNTRNFSERVLIIITPYKLHYYNRKLNENETEAGNINIINFNLKTNVVLNTLLG